VAIQRRATTTLVLTSESVEGGDSWYLQDNRCHHLLIQCYQLANRSAVPFCRAIHRCCFLPEMIVGGLGTAALARNLSGSTMWPGCFLERNIHALVKMMPLERAAAPEVGAHSLGQHQQSGPDCVTELLYLLGAPWPQSLN